jgi:acetylornithine deacetylase/succinyl-diaminopimelate desuccinylase-like protein
MAGDRDMEAGAAARGGARLGRTKYAGAAVLAGLLMYGVLRLAHPTTAAPREPGAQPPLTDDEIVALVRDYLRIDTSNPPGNEIRGARFFKALFDREGIQSEIYEFAPGRANLVARLNGTGARRPLLLLNHMDVVNAERPHWTVDPFAGELKDGYVYGRGALDMKTTGMLEAVVLINARRAGRPLLRDLIFVATADEEVNADGVTWLVEKRPDLVRGAEFMINEGGVIEAVGGSVRSYDVGVTEKSPLWVKVTARGRPGHGSQPFTRDNAVLTLVRALDRLARYETPIRLTPAAEAFFRARAASQPKAIAAKYRNIREAIREPAFRRTLEDDPYLNAIIRNTISITMLQGSPQTNIIPTTAEARLDIRLLPDEDPAAFLKEIERVMAEPDLSVEPYGAWISATASPVESEMMRAIDRARARHHPRATLAPTILTGWTESAMMRPLGIQAYGFEPFVLEQSEQARAHGNDERISVENIARGARILEEIVLDVAGTAPAALTDAGGR